MTTRRTFLATTAAATVIAATPAFSAAEFEISLSEAEWKTRLSPARFAVLRDWKREKPHSNSLYGESSSLLAEA
jgi:peptide-methionine (R)-S-oxide reductase